MYQNGKRMMAWITKIDKVVKHPDADSLDICTVGGWQCVTKLGEFKPGDLVVFFEIDSWIPHSIAPFLTPKGKTPSVYNGVEGERLRTVKLRGQLSQGLIMPYQKFPEVVEYMKKMGPDCSYPLDLTEILGIQKWEPPTPTRLGGEIKGNFPSRIPKTEQERVQNLIGVVFDPDNLNNFEYEITIKLDGTSMTVYHMDGEVGVCSRNYELKLDQRGNALVDTAHKIGILDKLSALGRNIAIHGELMGPGIQGNREDLKDHQFFVFDVWDVDNARYLTPQERYTLCEELGLLHVPVVYPKTTLKELGITNLEMMLKFADGSSLNNKIREGVVFKRLDGKFSFKAISNEFLLKGGN
jgi:RNA ligase (TIGR02306 family)